MPECVPPATEAKREAFIARFLEFIDKDGPVHPQLHTACWLWTGSRSRKQRRGYGRFSVGRDMRAAHRVSFELFVARIPDGLAVLHACDVRSCVNPEHLFVGTIATNNLDRDAKGRHIALRGTSNGNSRLTDTQVRAILAEFRDGASKRKLALKYKVTHRSIQQIVLRKTWAHIEFPAAS